MIGRLKPILNVLGGSEHARYKSHYCGICAATKGTFGRRASLGHSSEMVFVSLLLEGLEPDDYATERAWCTALPVIPRAVAVGPDRHALAVAAGVLATLQLDLKDAREDRERRIKQLLCRPLFAKGGPIDPATAGRAPFVRLAIAGQPQDAVGEVVAGVIGSVFRLAGLGDEFVAIGCRIGHAMGRLMNLSDALDDYFDDLESGRENALRTGSTPVDDRDVERRLHATLDELDALVSGLPLLRNRDLVDELIRVHARARVDTALGRFRDRTSKTEASTARPDKVHDAENPVATATAG